MPSNRKQTFPLRRGAGFPFLVAGSAFAALALMSSVAIAGGGGISSGGGGGGGGGGDASSKYTFPVKGKHTYGDGFGAGRNHQGQDVFAKCGTPLVALGNGKVQTRAKHSAAGHYIVLDVKGSKADFVYSHLKKKASVRQGRRVSKGQTIGAVGDSGNASGCHLHFEKWSAPGWYEGGEPLASVTRFLKKLDKQH